MDMGTDDMSTQEVPEQLTKVIMMVILMARSGIDHERIIKEAEEAILSHMIDKQKVEEAIGEDELNQEGAHLSDYGQCADCGERDERIVRNSLRSELRQALNIGKEE